MRAAQKIWQTESGWQGLDGPDCADAQAVFVFGAPEVLTAARLDEIQSCYPKARIGACTTGGEIFGRHVRDASISAVALAFDAARVDAVQTRVADHADAFAAGRILGTELRVPDLKSVFVLSDGILVNGGRLVQGLRAALGDTVVVTGGLAGDGARFGETRVGLGTQAAPGNIVAFGFRGAGLRVAHGSFGGWDPFGPERRITRSEDNILFELDGLPALDLYKRYLGEEARDLPGSALLFPLHIYPQGREDTALVRTIVGIDEARQAMIFAGSMPEGQCARLMKGSIDRLTAGAFQAGEQAATPGTMPSVSLAVSCIGRKLLYGQRIGDEIEALSDALGPAAHLSGFYSYGEISPHHASGFCELHNQTMTVTTLWEDL